MYTLISSVLLLAVLVRHIECACDSRPGCQYYRDSDGFPRGPPCCQCRIDFPCRPGERFESIDRVPRCCSEMSRIIGWREGFLPTGRVSEARNVFITPQIHREWRVPRRGTEELEPNATVLQTQDRGQIGRGN